MRSNVRTRRRHVGWRVGLVLLGLLAMGVGAAPVAAADPDPVLLVHGWRGHPSTFAEMIERFRAAGRTAVAIDLPGENNITNAAAIRDFIVAQKWSRVDIVGQSMGGLSARHFIKFVDASKVDAYVSLGTPQYGMYRTCVLPISSGGHMCPTRSFLRNLNGGDDTPGSVYWTTLYSRSDGLVSTSASRLDGGACHISVAGPSHNYLDNDAAVFGMVLQAVDRSCVGTFK